MQQIKQSDLDAGILSNTPISRLLAGNRFTGSWHGRESAKALIKIGGLAFVVRHRHIGAWACVTQEALDANERWLAECKEARAFDEQEALEEGSSESPRDSWWFAQ